MRISDWSSDVCSSDLLSEGQMRMLADTPPLVMGLFPGTDFFTLMSVGGADDGSHGPVMVARTWIPRSPDLFEMLSWILVEKDASPRSEEHTSELQSLMRISYAVFCLKKKKRKQTLI